MACFEAEWVAPSRQVLRQRSEIKNYQEITSFPVTPRQRAYQNNYYFLKCSTAKGRAADVNGVAETLEGEEPSLEQSLQWRSTPPGQPEPLRRIPSGKIFNNCHGAPVRYNQSFLTCCCSYPCCEIPNCGQKNIGSAYNTEASYLQHFKAVNNILLPNVARMAYERDEWYDEDSTSRYEASLANRYGKFFVSGKSANGGRETRKSNLETVDNVKKEFSAGQRLPSKQYLNMDVNMSRGENSGEKRKCDFFSESEPRQGGIGKRFQAETSQVEKLEDVTGYRRYFKPAFVDDKKVANFEYGHEEYSKPNTFPIVVTKATDMCKVQSKTVTVSKDDFHETKANFGAGSPGYLTLKSVPTQVGEGVEKRHGLHQVSVSSPSPARSEPTMVLNEHGSTEENRGNDEGQFISLDSTKSSFLTLMKNWRKQSDDVIPCPYCRQTFPRYADLKIHVQTHVITAHTSAGDNATEARAHKCPVSLSRGETMSGAQLLPEVDTPRDRTPGDKVTGNKTPGDKVPGGKVAGDEAKTRATSVIMFVGHNTK